jgi:imidazolonepropionase-like amidohydrolase
LEPTSSSPLKALADAKTYARTWDDFRAKNDKNARPPKTDLTLSALSPIAKGERPVFIAASNRDDVEAAVKFGRDNRVPVVVSGGRNADLAAAILNKAGVPVIFSELWAMPTGQDAYDKNFAAPRRLFEQGVKFCIATSEPVNLAQIAGTAAAYGLPREEALKSITLYPAQILGVEKELGSIEAGKIADLLLTDGDPFEYKTKIRKIFVNGVEVPQVSKHTQLYEEYRKRK